MSIFPGERKAWFSNPSRNDEYTAIAKNWEYHLIAINIYC
jgi:hypothetical protein